jgi:RNA exonuclease 4
MPFHNLYIAMDCEMVATETGRVCARVVLVDWKGRTLLDTHVKSEQIVTDYLTFVSGITAEALTDAPSFSEVQAQVKYMLEGKILVGHGLENDLASLQMDHPWWMIRDTAYYQPYMQVRHNGGESFHVPRKLKDLCKQRLKTEIQVMGVAHCPYEDAKAALDLYKSHRPRWESCVTSQIHQQRKLVRQQMRQQAYYGMAPVFSVAY